MALRPLIGWIGAGRMGASMAGLILRAGYPVVVFSRTSENRRKLVAQGAKKLPITDTRMTRFWITLEQGVEFVMKSFQRMKGGEIFVPKIPSVRIIDLAQSIAPGLAHDVIGIRPGEKLHEVMCPADDSHLTLEFPDHFVIKPTILFSEHVDFATNALGEVGAPVAEGFEYSSGTNPRFLTVEQLKDMDRP